MTDFISNFWGIFVVVLILIYLTFKVIKFRSLALADLSANHAKQILDVREQKFDTATNKADAEISIIRASEKEMEFLRLRYLAIGVLLYLTATVLSLYLWKFNGLAFGDTADVWGQMGDYFGGMLNPIFAFASFMALLYTIRIQSEELRMTREELSKSAAAAQLSAELEKQNLEQQRINNSEQLRIAQYQSISTQLQEKSKVINNTLYAPFVSIRKDYSCPSDSLFSLFLIVRKVLVREEFKFADLNKLQGFYSAKIDEFYIQLGHVKPNLEHPIEIIYRELNVANGLLWQLYQLGFSHETEMFKLEFQTAIGVLWAAKRIKTGAYELSTFTATIVGTNTFDSFINSFQLYELLEAAPLL